MRSLGFVTLRVSKIVKILKVRPCKVKHRSTPACTGGSTLDPSKIDKLLHIRCLKSKVLIDRYYRNAVLEFIHVSTRFFSDQSVFLTAERPALKCRNAEMT